MRVAEHRARVARTHEIARQRSEHGFEMWQAEQARVRRVKQVVVERLEKAASSWVTEDNLDDVIERVLDDLTIASTRRTEFANPSPDGPLLRT